MHFSCLNQQAVTITQESKMSQWACPVRHFSHFPWGYRAREVGGQNLLMGMSTAMLQYLYCKDKEVNVCAPVGGYVLPFRTISN